MILDQESWEDLYALLKDINTNAVGEEIGIDQWITETHQALLNFYSTAGMLGAPELEAMGKELESFLNDDIATSKDEEKISLFGFAINTFITEMGKEDADFDTSKIDFDEIRDLISMDSSEEETQASQEEPEPAAAVSEEPEEAKATSEENDPAPEPEPAPNKKIEVKIDLLDDLTKGIEKAGGTIDLSEKNKKSQVIKITMPKKQMANFNDILYESVMTGSMSEQMAEHDPMLMKIVEKLVEFMRLFSSGELVAAQKVIEGLTGEQYKAELYNQIGRVARELHDSLNNILNVLDPTLTNVVETRIPDSESRLKHIIQMTEKAANTTLDHIEFIQDRTAKDTDRLNSIKSSLNDLNTLLSSIDLLHAKNREHFEGADELYENIANLIGMAKKQIQNGALPLDDFKRSFDATSNDLVTILTAQDFQDLTGQVIQKIIVLLKDLETKLVHLITKFGVKVGSSGTAVVQEEELYGPAHDQREATSQSEVDKLLADFGF